MNRLLAFLSPLFLIVLIGSCGPTKTPAVAAKVHHPAKKSETDTERKLPPGQAKPPERPPEIFGVIERIEKRSVPKGDDFEAVLIKGHPPLVGKLQPSSPLILNGQPDHLWLNLRGTTVARRSGPLAIGQYVWVWHHGHFYDTEPAQIYPEYVISESVLPK